MLAEVMFVNEVGAVVDEVTLGKLVEFVDWLIGVLDKEVFAESFSFSLSLLFLLFFVGVDAVLVEVFVCVDGTDTDGVTT